MTNTETTSDRLNQITAIIAVMNLLEKQIAKAETHASHDTLRLNGYQEAHKSLRWALVKRAEGVWHASH